MLRNSCSRPALYLGCICDKQCHRLICVLCLVWVMVFGVGICLFVSCRSIVFACVREVLVVVFGVCEEAVLGALVFSIYEEVV